MSSATADRAIAFVDLAGFTSLTDAHGDRQAADLQQSFLAALRTSLGDSVECVKHLGDGALLAASQPVALLECLTGLAAGWSADPHAPLLRVGAHRGEVVEIGTEHGPDYLGATVNTAARLCELAAGGQLVHSAALLDDAASAGLASRPLGARRLRGISSPVEVAVVDLTGGVGAAVDPVCRMPVPAGTGAGNLQHDGRTYAFCSLACAGRFAAAPADFATE